MCIHEVGIGVGGVKQAVRADGLPKTRGIDCNRFYGEILFCNCVTSSGMHVLKKRTMEELWGFLSNGPIRI